MLLTLLGCSTPSTQLSTDVVTPEVALNLFKKICIEGSGRGRIELLTQKHLFSYESLIDKKKNMFFLGLEFPIIGERQVALSLNPVETNRVIKNVEITEMLKEHLGERKDKARIAKAVEEFFVFTSDFLRFKTSNTLPPHYNITLKDDHFLLERSTQSYRFLVDNFSLDKDFYQRFVLKLFIKEYGNDPILTLFLIPETCEK